MHESYGEKEPIHISVIDQTDYQVVDKIYLDFKHDKANNCKHQILSMTVCDNERSLAVIYGEKLNKNRKDPLKIFIFERNEGEID
mgnify:CR=1 FL=1